MKKRIEHARRAGACPSGWEERVLALTDGSRVADDERAAVLEHLVDCTPCRYLLEDFIDVEAEGGMAPLADGVRGLVAIAVKLVAGGLKALTPNLSAPVQLASVLGAAEGRLLEYRVTVGLFDRRLCLRRSGVDISIELDGADPNEKYYLIGGETYVVSSPYQGVVVFENITAGSYLVSRDKREFLLVRVE